ncbi:MAG: ATP-binding protein [Formivibrio sp.]|nr:ATP-binding protein [Formivibrio sp.]
MLEILHEVFRKEGVIGKVMGRGWVCARSDAARSLTAKIKIWTWSSNARIKNENLKSKCKILHRESNMEQQHTNTGAKLPSLAWFARQLDPFQDLTKIAERLKLETAESKHVEWKSTPPIGSSVNLRTKFRVVKAAISFANTEGGFIVFGIESKGKWLGFTEAELKETDPAALAELINGCVSPELVGLNYAHLTFSGQIFPVLHVPPSPQIPHVTTKEIQERLPDGKTVLHLNKYAVYCRYVAKSDLATPAQFARIIALRTDFLKSEMLRRVKEVPVAAFVSTSKASSGSPTILRVTKGGKDTSIPAVRITRNPSEAAGMIVTEELSDGLFDEINNVLDANDLLARNRSDFVFGELIYYRIYAERQHIKPAIAKHQMLSKVATLKFYAPGFFWLLKLSPEQIASLVKEVLAHDKATNNRIVCRLAILLGPKVTAWLKLLLDRHWQNHAQPAEHYRYFKKLIKKANGVDRRITAIQELPNAELIFGDSETILIGELLKSPNQASACLSKACMAVFNGDMAQKTVCRQLDLITYGSEFAQMEESVLAALEKQIRL